jgi:hypothetical protein
MNEDGFESTLASWILFPKALPYTGFCEKKITLNKLFYSENIGATESLNQKQI